MNSTYQATISTLFRLPSCVMAAGLLLAAAAPATAEQISIFNTGVSSTGTRLPGAQADPHWQVVAGPNIAAPASAFVVNNQHPFGQYFETADSRWIWVTPTGNISPGGPYTFRLTFDLTNLNPTTASISGGWGIDDTGGQIRLNGAIPPGMGLSLIPTSFDNLNIVHPFTITGGFTSGLNYLEITVSDSANPGALNVTSLIGTAAPVPELSSLLYLVGGAMSLLAYRHQRRRGQ